MTEDSLMKQTLKWMAGLLGASILWVGGLSLVSLLVVHLALGGSAASPTDSPATTGTSATTPGAKPASSVAPPSGTDKRPSDDPPAKRRFG
jgi:hypothetical protein